MSGSTLSYARKRGMAAIAVSAVIIVLAGCSRGPSAVGVTMEHDGMERSYRVYVPSAYSEAAPVPLVLVLHGRLGSGRNIERWSRFTPVAEEAGFIAVYPDGINRQWNNGRSPDARNMTVSHIDDTGFLLALIETLKEQYAIDAGAVFATGMSNGGMMSHRLAFDAPGVFAAVAPVVSAIPEGQAEAWCEGPPVPILMINGTDDWLVPWEGGEMFGREGFGSVLSPRDTAALWARRNGCSPEPETVSLPASSRGSQVFIETYDCADAPVVLYRIEGGGHTWPGGSRFQFRVLLGTINRDFEASRAIWEFFHAARR
jgi:polyhydroxybutyrate depolymerase